MDSTPPANSRTDDELLRTYLDPDVDDDGEAFNAIWCGYRDEVRRLLEEVGLSAKEAENRVGAVFIIALDRDASDPPHTLREILHRIAHEVARDPQWRPI